MKLEVKNITKSFGETNVLKGISFSVESGKALGLLGRNGAGKTTTIRILMDVFHANSGEITLDSKPFDPRRVQIGYLPEERGLYPKRKILEQMVYLAMLRGISRKNAVINARHWLERLEVLPYEDKLLETLSKGNQQKVQLAATLVHNPPVIILDEPFSGLDPVNSQVLKDVIQEQIAENKLVIFSSHQMSYVEEFCNDIVIMNHGETVLSGDLREIKTLFGHGRLVLSLNGKDGEETEAIVKERFPGLVQPDGIHKDFVVLKMTGETTKTQVFRALAESGLDVESFGDYRPSLNDIFVERAGDEA